MTVGIGCLCEYRNPPGLIVLGSDMRGSYGPTVNSHHQTGKVFDLQLGFMALIAGHYSECESFVSQLHEEFRKIEALSPVQLEHVRNAIMEAQFHTWFPICENALRFNFGLTHKQWYDLSRTDRKLWRNGRWLVRQVELSVEAIVAGFLNSGPVLLRMTGKRLIKEEPSHTVIGSGGIYAIKRLNYRGQQPYDSLHRTALHVTEALRLAKRHDKYVGPASECVVIGQNIQRRKFDPNNPLFNSWSSRNRPKDTRKLDTPDEKRRFESLLVTF